MEEEDTHSFVNGEERQKQQAEVVEAEDQQQLQHRHQLVAEDKLVLQFMDSVDNYLSLFDALSSTLRQVNNSTKIQLNYINFNSASTIIKTFQ